jgi:hypothetical protein
MVLLDIIEKMPIIKFASQRQSQLHKRNTKIAEVLFDVVDWKGDNGGNYSQMIKDLKSFMKATSGRPIYVPVGHP